MSVSRYRVFAGVVSSGLCLLFATGCGPHIPHSDKDRADVVVKIVLGGQPLTSGDVDLNNLTTGEGGGGKLDQTGTVKIPGVVLGDYIVTVLPPVAGAIPGEQSAATTTKTIPTLFQSPQTSPLELGVYSEGQEFVFDLDEAASRARKK